ncbi:hypothetical protein BJK05_13110 [Pectobacterium polaris]|uniref:hypothetical protein n=1 Tax=Pectobacterium polaris TaxID=2042057 RepID=UPI000BAC71AB|nr:hypothetical protein [Pectobacterium polaris]ASY80878.1 hypothetical protein BJK05_13110 [Pectobacterium polaris]MCA6941045.1 hypothetical protein [Pectobacterium polaris]MCA6952588.1 hypothetical protein [Pectobacterium polaris]MCA6955313.1 hypothetical protein [Pectobacterium polaris]
MKYTRLFSWRLNGVIGLRAASQKQIEEEDWRRNMPQRKTSGMFMAGYSTGSDGRQRAEAWGSSVNINLSVS